MQLDLSHFAGDEVPIGHVEKGDPLAALGFIVIEVLVLDAAGNQRQQQQVAGFPIFVLAVQNGVAGAFQYEDHQAALMAVHAAVALDVVHEYHPLAGAGALGQRVEIAQAQALTVL